MRSLVPHFAKTAQGLSQRNLSSKSIPPVADSWFDAGNILPELTRMPRSLRTRSDSTLRLAMRLFANAMALLAASLLSVGTAQAQLSASAGGQAVYDSTKNVTWLANANLAAVQNFGVAGINPDGSMGYTEAQQWVAAMNAAKYLGATRWRVPTTAVPDKGCSQNPKSSSFGYGCTGSEMGDLFYNKLGGAKGSTIALQHNSSFGLFNNLQPYLYWSGTTWPKVKNSAFSFSFGNGFQGTNVYVNAMYVIAVVPGKLSEK